MTPLFRRELSSALTIGLGFCILLQMSCGAGDSTSTAPSGPSGPGAAAGPTVQVQVAASDPDGDQLHYQWRATEGQVQNVDASSTQWTLPPGKGLQFLYVLVSDNKGGYRESRVAVLSGIDRVVSLTPSFTPTAGSTTRASLYGAVICSNSGSTFAVCPSSTRTIYVPNINVKLAGTGNSPTLITSTNFKGEFFFQDIPPGSYDLQYSLNGSTFFNGYTDLSIDSSLSYGSTTSRFEINIGSDLFDANFNPLPPPLATMTRVAGHVNLRDPAASSVSDKPLCGTSNQFFGTSDITATAELRSASNVLLAGPAPVNAFGDFLVAKLGLTNTDLTNARVRVVCETTSIVGGAFTLTAGGGTVVGPLEISNQRPVVTSMTAMFNGNRIDRPDFPKPTTMLPEMANALDDGAFLTHKGLDTRLSACRYYQTIGAVEGCNNTTGAPTGSQLTFDSWKQQHGLAPYDTGNPEIATIYINRADLNLVRDMHGQKLGPQHLAYYTCNYPGPLDVTSRVGAPKQIGDETQADIDLAFSNAQRNIGQLACVAMEYSVTAGANNSQPFTKFYTFGPSGNLQLSVSLDGRQEKFMPGTCTACHGGDLYGGRFPDNGSGLADVGSKWLPFDMSNFNFSTAQKQDMRGIEATMKQFNQLMISPDVSSITKDRTKELIQGWYAGGRLDQDQDFVPISWNFDQNLYRTVIRHSCQTCHTGQLRNEFISTNLLCGGINTLATNHHMPNVLVAFERFWLSADPSRPGYSADLDQPKLVGCSGSTAEKDPGL